MIVTFYSFKGGVGRSMALVNVGEILADRGYDVILCDWDLEAPGLERYLLQTEDESFDAAAEYARLIAAPGLTDLLADYKQRMAAAPPRNPVLDQDHALLGQIPLRKPSSLAVPVSAQRVRPGSLRLLTAGRRDGENERRYAEFVTRFDWEDFYARWAGGSYIEFLRQDLVGVPQQRGACDILLIDSRTGVTEQSGICTHHLADLVVLLSAANQANLNGIGWMARSLASEHLKALRGDREIDVLPVRARIDDGAQVYELSAFRSEFMAAMREHFPRSLPHVESLALKLEIPYRALYSFQERAVAREPIQKREQKLYDAYVALADAIITVGNARALLPEKSEHHVSLTAVAPRTVSPSERPRLVLVTASPSEEPAAKRILQELRSLGFNAAGTFERTTPVWLRDAELADRCVAVLDPLEPPEEHFRLAPILRRQALDPEKRVIPLVRGRIERSAFNAQSISMPDTLEPGDPFFSALAEEILSTRGAQLRSFGDVTRPFPGRNAYGENDALFFFGREAELYDLTLGIGGGHRWISFGGPSGIGKTSFINAALLPAIRAGMIDAIPANATIARWDASKNAESAYIGSSEPVVLVAENFERLLLADADPRLIEQALRTIQQLLLSSSKIWVISSVSHMLQRRLDEMPIVKQLQDSTLRYDLGPLSSASVRAAIVGPVHLAGRSLERGLADRLFEQLSPFGNAPMFLNDAMKRLWDAASDNVLTHAVLDRAGGVADLVAATAEDALSSITSTGLQWPVVEETLMMVVTADGAPKRAFPPSAARVAGSERVLHTIAASRLLRFDEEVEIGHPQLPTLWPRLADSITRQHERLAARDTVDGIFAAPSGKLSLLLPLGPGRRRFERLVNAGGTLISPPVHKAVRAARLTEYVAIVGVILAIVVAIAGAIMERRSVDTATDQEKLAASLRAKARIQTDPVTALLVAMEAGQLSSSTSTEETLIYAIRNSPCRLILRSKGVRDVAFSPIEQNAVLIADDSSTVTMYSLATGAPLGHPLGLGATRTMTLAPNDLLITTGIAKGVRVYDAATGAMRFNEQTSSVVTAAKSSPPFLAAGFEDGGITVWRELLDPRITQSVPRNGDTILDLAFNPDRSQMMAVSDTHEGFYRVRVYSLNLRRPVRERSLLFKAEPSISNTPFGLGGRRIAWATDGRVRVWGTSGTDNGNSIENPRGATVAAFNPVNDDRLAIGTADGTIHMRQLLGDTPTVITTRVLRGHRAAITHISFDSSGMMMLSADASGEVRVWDLEQDELPSGVDRLLIAARERLPVNLTETQRTELLAAANQ